MATPGSGVRVVKTQLEEGKIVPDVIGSFGPELLDVRVSYKEVEVANGLILRKEQTQIKPHVELHGPSAKSADHFYTLVMVDPDAPSPSKPSFRNFLHWLVVNIPSNVAFSDEIWQVGHEVVPYMGPAPPEGDHRYAFLVFKQETRELKVEDVLEEKRQLFDVEKFAKTYKLGPAVGGIYYVTSALEKFGHSGQFIHYLAEPDEVLGNSGQQV